MLIASFIPFAVNFIFTVITRASPPSPVLLFSVLFVFPRRTAASQRISRPPASSPSLLLSHPLFSFPHHLSQHTFLSFLLCDILTARYIIFPLQTFFCITFILILFDFFLLYSSFFPGLSLITFDPLLFFVFSLCDALTPFARL